MLVPTLIPRMELLLLEKYINQKENKNELKQLNGALELLMKIRDQARNDKDFETSDLIRDELTRLGVQLKDSKDGTEWKK